MFTYPHGFMRSDGFTDPTDIDGLEFWLDGANVGSTAQQWDDMSGNGNHWTSSSAALFPTYDGADDSMRFSSDSLDGYDMSSLTAGEIFMRLKIDNDPPLSEPTSGLFHFSVHVLDSLYPYTDNIHYNAFGTTVRKTCGNATQDLEVYHTLNIRTAAGNWGIDIGSQSLYSTGTNTVGFRSGPTIGKTGSSLYLLGNVKSVVMYNRVLTTQERSDMKDYMDAL